QLMQGAGIDVALVPVGGATAERRAASLRSLAALVEALIEARDGTAGPASRGRDHPPGAPPPHPPNPARSPGGTLGLREADVQRARYSLIRDFYLRVPEEFRATVPLSEATGGGDTVAWAASPWGTAAIVRLTGGEAIRGADDASLANCSRRFGQEFGARL